MLDHQILVYLLIGIILASVTNFSLTLLLKKKTTFDYILRALMMLIAANSGVVYVNLEYFANKPWLYRMVPFSLLYGPMLYLSAKFFMNYRISAKKVWLHCTPFILSCIFNLTFLYVMGAERDRLSIGLFNKMFYAQMSLSLLAYTLWLLFSKKITMIGKLKSERWIFVFTGVIFLVVGAMSLVVLFSSGPTSEESTTVYFLRLIIYLFMFLFIVVILAYYLSRLKTEYQKQEKVLISDLNMDKVKGTEETIRYKSSSLTDEQLDAYEKDLVFKVKRDELFLVNSLSLGQLAEHLKIPKHHLTQVFGIKMKQTFYQYINGLRIEHACRLLRERQEITLEDLSIICGFNSKGAFNRQFKALTNCTPSAYRDQESDSSKTSS
jgi:AraC-like DNA-binding protein